MLAGTFHTSCHRCDQPVDVPREEVTLRVPGIDGSGGAWWFRCPACGRQCAKGADEAVARLLFDNGAPLEGWTEADDEQLASYAEGSA